jgi:hypothetical protein
MTIANYAELQASVATWLNRTDLTAQIPDFITIAESRIALTLRTREMIKAVQLEQKPGESSIAVPADWLAWDALSMEGTGDDALLQYVSPATFADWLWAGNTTNSGWYTIEAGRLVVAGLIPSGAPDITVNTTYYARVPPLDGTADTNWLLLAHPEVYLYGALVSGWQYILDEQRAAQNAGLFDASIQLINANSLKASVSGSMWRQQPR